MIFLLCALHSHKAEWPIAGQGAERSGLACGSPGLANLSPPPEVRTPTDCRAREPRASGPSRRHPASGGLLPEEMWLGGGWSPTGRTLRGRPRRPSPAPSGAGTLARLRGLSWRCPRREALMGVRGGKGACSCVARSFSWPAGRPLVTPFFYTRAACSGFPSTLRVLLTRHDKLGRLGPRAEFDKKVRNLSRAQVVPSAP